MSAEQEKIKDLAYRLWQDAGSPHGRDQEFWFAAEAQVSAAPSAPAVATTPKAPKPKAASSKPKTESKAAPKAKPAAAPKAAKPKAKTPAKT